jgi:uncharacterized membrane protein
MWEILASPGRSLAAGAAVTLVILALWLLTAGADRIGLLSFLLRWLHVFAGIVWVGMVWFVNFIQLVALQEADDAGRAALLKSVAPRVAHSFRHASHMSLLTGVLLLLAGGYLLDRWLFTAEVYIPPARAMALWGGVLGGLLMWAFAHFIIWPNLKVVLGHTPGDAAATARAREQIKTYARWNLILSVPVTFTMVAAAHLF